MLSLAIQAGGDSSRMGQDKALMPFLGQPLITRVIERLSTLSDDIFITTNHPQGYEFLDLRLVPDRIPGGGALGGLFTALEAARRVYVAVVACDMPFASLSLFRFAWDTMLEEAPDAVVPSTGKGIEPFHALYRRETCLPLVEAAIEAGESKLIAWFPRSGIRILTPEETSRYTANGLAFLNLNTPEEFRLAEEKARSIPD